MTTDAFDFTDHSHKRFNPLLGSWVLCSPHRAKRPWLGQQEKTATETLPEYDSSCYLCPRNARVGGQDKNPDYPSTHVFPNDFPAVKRNQPEYTADALLSLGSAAGEDATPDRRLVENLLRVQGVRGEARVVCFSPKHNLTMAEMNESDILEVIRTWTTQYKELSALEHVTYVQMFENKGAVMGCSNPHPHGQIWATSDIPEIPAKEIESISAYRASNHSCLLCDYVRLETTGDNPPRVVCANDSFICVVPFWAVWPFETLIVPRSHVSAVTQLTAKQQQDLANILRRITCRYDNLFETNFPYSMGVHQAPVREPQDGHVMHMHIHFFPPLLRSATIKKFLVGFEMLGEPQRDLTSEQAAARLRALPEVHYKHAAACASS